MYIIVFSLSCLVISISKHALGNYQAFPSVNTHYTSYNNITKDITQLMWQKRQYLNMFRSPNKCLIKDNDEEQIVQLCEFELSSIELFKNNQFYLFLEFNAFC